MSTARNAPLPPLTIGDAPSLTPRRRGSMAAPDPFGTFPNTTRTMTSTLHIIKAPSHNTFQDANERSRQLTRTRARSNSGGNVGTRISFAFSGFGPVSPRRDNSSGSRSSEPSRSASPLNANARSKSFTNISTMSHTLLTPIQVYDLAQQCNNPHSRPCSPVGNTSIPSSPVNFTPLPEDYRLPFLDRPKEVEDLLSQPLTSKLFMLLAQTIPANSSSSSAADPSSWRYPQLEHWLTQTSRDEVGDLEWVQKAKLCISTRSELIWERVKAALGVPPELDSVNELSGKHNDSRHGTPSPESRLDDENLTESFGDTWVEPILTSSVSSSPIRSPAASFSRSPVMTLQGLGRMEDISEDISEDVSENLSESDSPPIPTPAVHGVRVVVSPSEPLECSFSSSPSPSVSQSHVPYDAISERGPGHPLFPTSFANLALGPTLQAKCVSSLPGVRLN